MTKFGPYREGDVTLVLPKEAKAFPQKVSLKLQKDLIIPYSEDEILSITLPNVLFSPTGKGVSDRTSREKDGSLTRSATAFQIGAGDIVVVLANGQKVTIACEVS